MNVLIILLDSVSLNYLKRAFSATYKYLNEQEENSILENYISIGINTYPNIVPFLSGVLVNDIKEFQLESENKILNQNDPEFHDIFPFIWKKFQKLGYVTMFSENSVQTGTFNSGKRGFRFNPTTVYHTPYWAKYHNLKSNFCLNGEPLFKRSIDQIRLFIETMNNNFNKNIPYFSFNAFNYYNHDYLSVPRNYDLYLRDTIKYFVEKGYLDNTLFMLMSDHGPRLTEYGIYTEIGRKEAFLPFLSFRFPKKMVKTRFHINFSKNKYKLVSHLDGYKTLMHFYYLNKYNDLLYVQNSGCQDYFRKSFLRTRSLRGVSLFEDVNQNRTCREAIIPDKYCPCNKEVLSQVKESEFFRTTKLDFKKAALLVLNSLNQITEKFRSKCSLFEIEKIKSIQKIQIQNSDPIFRFEILMQPGDALFESMFRFNSNAKNFEPTDLSRFNLYKNQSDCLSDKTYYGFCFCI